MRTFGTRRALLALLPIVATTVLTAMLRVPLLLGRQVFPLRVEASALRIRRRTHRHVDLAERQAVTGQTVLEEAQAFLDDGFGAFIRSLDLKPDAAALRDDFHVEFTQ